MVFIHLNINTLWMLVPGYRFSLSASDCGSEKIFFVVPGTTPSSFILCIPFPAAGNVFLLLFFSPLTGQKQMNSHESWSLSPEEFEIWDRLYRIKESDGIKEPVLPRVQFETLENLEEPAVSSMQCFL